MMRPSDINRRARPLAFHFRLAAAGWCAFVGWVSIEGAHRPGYRPWRHAISQLSLGEGGWRNVVGILVVALSLVVFARALTRRMPDGPGATWGPRLLWAAAGSFALLAVFPIDPALGFPESGAPQHSVSGLVHGVAGTVAFATLSAAAFVLGRRLRADARWRRWGTASIAVGAVVALGYLATGVLTGLDMAGVLPDAPGGLVQRASLFTGLLWFGLLGLRLARVAP